MANLKDKRQFQIAGTDPGADHGGRLGSSRLRPATSRASRSTLPRAGALLALERQDPTKAGPVEPQLTSHSSRRTSQPEPGRPGRVDRQRRLTHRYHQQPPAGDDRTHTGQRQLRDDPHIQREPTRHSTRTGPLLARERRRDRAPEAFTRASERLRQRAAASVRERPCTEGTLGRGHVVTAGAHGYIVFTAGTVASLRGFLTWRTGTSHAHWLDPAPTATGSYRLHAGRFMADLRRSEIESGNWERPDPEASPSLAPGRRTRIQGLVRWRGCRRMSMLAEVG